MAADPRWQEWVGWLGKEPKPGTIMRDVYGMIAARQIWETFQEIVVVAPDPAKKYGTFHSWFNASYLHAQGLAVRRQVDVKKGVVSLARLLGSVARSPGVVSRERFVAELYPDDPRDGNGDFDRLVGQGVNALSRRVVRDELKDLANGTAKVKTWIDKEVAHYDRNTGQFSEGLTFDDVHEAVDLIFDVYSRYCALLLGSQVLRFVAIQQPWEAVFRHPWIPDDDALRHVRQAAREKEQGRLGATPPRVT
jgi:hypothetical protein